MSGFLVTDLQASLYGNSPVGWRCRIHDDGISAKSLEPPTTSVLHMTVNHLMVRLVDLENVGYIAPWSSLTQSGST